MIIFRNCSNMARIVTKLCQNAFQTISDVSFFDAEKNLSAQISDRKFCVSPTWCGFGRATAKRMSKPACSSNFALDRFIERPVRPKIIGFGENLGFLKNFHSIVGDRFSGGFFSAASNHNENHLNETLKTKTIIKLTQLLLLLELLLLLLLLPLF